MPVALLFLVLGSVLFAGCWPPPSKSNTGVNRLLAGKTPSSRPDRHIVVKTFHIYFWGICKRQHTGLKYILVFLKWACMTVSTSVTQLRSAPLRGNGHKAELHITAVLDTVAPCHFANFRLKITLRVWIPPKPPWKAAICIIFNQSECDRSNQHPLKRKGRGYGQGLAVTEIGSCR